jgi:hypothetical protein
MVSRMAIVASTVLAIIGVFPFQERDNYSVFRCASRVPGAGGSPKATEALQKRAWGVEGRKSVARAVAVVGMKACARRKKWRAEVGPRMRGAPPRPAI